MARDKPQPYVRYPVKDFSDEGEEERSYRPGFLFSRHKRQGTTTTTSKKTTARETTSEQQQSSSTLSSITTTNLPAVSSSSTATCRTAAVFGSNLPTSDSWCRCGNCSDMPAGVEKKCCMDEMFDLTNFQDPGFKPREQCVLESNFILNTVLHTGHLQLSWVAQRRFLGFRSPQEIDVRNMDNANYRFSAYRSYINFIYGFLGRRNRRVIPACVVGHIRNCWPSPDGVYVGYKPAEDDDEEEDNHYIPADELQAIADGTEI